MPATDSPTARPASPARVGAWQLATVEAVRVETYRTRSFRVSVPGWQSFRAGQHVDVRLTAPDGYQAQRSYSIASAPEAQGFVELTVELVTDGEVSSWFHEVARAGDTFELRGPIGGPFTWSAPEGGPLLLVAGGSGVVPLMSMLRHRQAQAQAHAGRALLLYSSRTIDDAIYREELETLADSPDGPGVAFALTRERPAGWTGLDRRIDAAIVGKALAQLGEPRHVFVCGPTPFVETVATILVDCKVETDRIRTERFGPSG